MDDIDFMDEWANDLITGTMYNMDIPMGREKPKL